MTATVIMARIDGLLKMYFMEHSNKK